MPGGSTSTSVTGATTTTSNSAFATTAREVWRWFEEHLDQLIESVRAFRFDTYEMQVRSFWSGLNGEHKEIVHAPAVAGLMARADALVYDVSPPRSGSLLLPFPDLRTNSPSCYLSSLGNP
jgi:regulatory factor X